MRICILYCPRAKGEDTALKELCDALARGLYEQSGDFSVEIFNMYTEVGKKLAFYDYILVGCQSSGFFGGRIPEQVSIFLRQAGQVSGKRCFAFVQKKGLFCMKSLSSLMSALEKEGLYLKNSEILANKNYAYATGKRLRVAKN